MAIAVVIPRPARAMDKDVRSVLVGGGYGLLGGTLLGLASYPLTRDARSVWIGSSVGLYLGLVVGIYYAIDRNNPENPLKTQVSQAEPAGSGSGSGSGSNANAGGSGGGGLAAIAGGGAGGSPADSELNLSPSTKPDLYALGQPGYERGQTKSGPPAWLDIKVPVAHF
jgi:hypothetical protein